MKSDGTKIEQKMKSFLEENITNYEYNKTLENLKPDFVIQNKLIECDTNKDA
jgi:G:T-mismatch repair DNA endonuclease (very short patch repair protein)